MSWRFVLDHSACLLCVLRVFWSSLRFWPVWNRLFRCSILLPVNPDKSSSPWCWQTLPHHDASTAVLHCVDGAGSSRSVLLWQVFVEPLSHRTQIRGVLQFLVDPVGEPVRSFTEFWAETALCLGANRCSFAPAAPELKLFKVFF